MASVREIWRGGLPPGTVVLAGDDGLDREVSGVLVLRARTSGLGTPRGGELVLLSTRTLQALDPQLGLDRALHLIAGDVAAVAVLGEIPRQAVDGAADLALPLLQLPTTAALADVEREVRRFLAEHRSEWYRRKESVLQELTALAVQGAGIDTIAGRMGALCGQAVLFEDAQGAPLATHLPASFTEADAETVQAYLDGRGAIPELRPGRPRGAPSPQGGTRPLARLVTPVSVGGMPGVTASLVGPEEALGQDCGLVLEAGATAAAIELAREQAVRETVHRIQGDLVSDLIYGESDAQTLERRAARLGYDLTTPHAALAIHPVPLSPDVGDSGSDVFRALQRRLTHVVSSNERQAPFHLEGRVLAVFYPVESDLSLAALKRLADRLAGSLADAARDHRLLIGVSRVHAGADGFRVSFEEARRALELGRAVAPNRSITCFQDLGVYRLLLAVRDRGEMEDFHEDLLGRLARYDRERNAELVTTLDAYLRGRNASEVAEHLSLHRNTLLYRLRRIREITDLDLNDPETRFRLYLALRVREALRTAGAMGI